MKGVRFVAGAAARVVETSLLLMGLACFIENRNVAPHNWRLTPTTSDSRYRAADEW